MNALAWAIVGAFVSWIVAGLALALLFRLFRVQSERVERIDISGDQAWDGVFQRIRMDVSDNALDPIDALAAWRLGLAVEAERRSWVIVEREPEPK